MCSRIICIICYVNCSVFWLKNSPILTALLLYAFFRKYICFTRLHNAKGTCTDMWKVLIHDYEFVNDMPSGKNTCSYFLATGYWLSEFGRKEYKSMTRLISFKVLSINDPRSMEEPHTSTKSFSIQNYNPIFQSTEFLTIPLCSYWSYSNRFTSWNVDATNWKTWLSSFAVNWVTCHL